ncbi:unnamed protein product, partial [Iphiclides podalirius]
MIRLTPRVKRSPAPYEHPGASACGVTSRADGSLRTRRCLTAHHSARRELTGAFDVHDAPAGPRSNEPPTLR